jgi:hypothetical protein
MSTAKPIVLVKITPYYLSEKIRTFDQDRASYAYNAGDRKSI